MKNRLLADLVLSRLREQKPLIQVVIGSRQVGKTTAVKAAFDAYGGVYETADYPTTLHYAVIEEWWRKALQHPNRALAVDEIQKISGWTEILKKLWDESDRKLKLVVTGSSALLMEKGLRETLAGRFELIRAEHWNFSEACDVFGMNLTQFIEFGCYPGAVPFLKDIDRWGQYIRDSIVEPAIGRDLQQLRPVEQPALLRQIFGLAASLPAQVVSLQKMQGQMGGKGTLPTIQNYLKLLGDAFLVSEVQKYSKSQFRARRSASKIIVHDNALIRAFERPILQGLSRERYGRYFENSIGARFLEAGWETYYWNDRRLEVDFVVIGPENQRWAIEVKTDQTTEEDLKGLFTFCRLNPDFEPCIISLVTQALPRVRVLDPQTILSLTRRGQGPR